MLELKYERFARRLGLRVLQIRRDLGLIQQELAQRAGINPGYLSLIENGQRLPSLETLVKLAEVLRVPLFEFFVLAE